MEIPIHASTIWLRYEAVFIDDSLPNVDAARARGWRGHHFTDAAGLEAELRGLGLI